MAYNGYVIRCRQCRHYQILFGNTLRSVTEAEFKKLVYEVSRRNVQEPEMVNPDERSIVIPLVKPGTHMVLSTLEFAAFLHLMEAAEAEATALELLNLF